jgi:hypothetical protein
MEARSGIRARVPVRFDPRGKPSRRGRAAEHGGPVRGTMPDVREFGRLGDGRTKDTRRLSRIRLRLVTPKGKILLNERTTTVQAD